MNLKKLIGGIMNRICCQNCEKHEKPECPVKTADPWSRYGNWCNEYSSIPERWANDKPKSQEDLLNEILKMKYLNPELDIKFCVGSEQVYESGWTYHEISRVEICPWYQEEEMIFTDKGGIIQRFIELIECEIFDDDVTDYEINQIAEERYKSVKQAICVFTSAV